MQDQPAPSQDGATPFTLREAAAALGISLNTLRRRIAAGQVQAERVQRPQGHVWHVYLHGAPTQEDRANSTVQQDGAGTVQQPPTAMMQAEAMAAYTRSLLEPLVQTVERQSERIEELAREVGELRAENRALVARTAPQPVEPSPEPPPARWSRWVEWSPTVALLVVTLVLAVLLLVRSLLLGWPR